MDLTFACKKALKISRRIIEKTWNLDEFNLKNGRPLGDYLKYCRVGDVWKSRTEWLECMSIDYHKEKTIIQQDIINCVKTD